MNKLICKIFWHRFKKELILIECQKENTFLTYLLTCKRCSEKREVKIYSGRSIRNVL